MKKRLIISGGIANVFEWYDYALFGHLAPILGAKFFPSSDPKASLLKAFLVFAAGYFIRPLGGVIFGIIGDKFGRKAALSLSILLMAFPTALIGILPTFESIGLTASVLLLCARLLQGLSMGGVLTSSVSFLIEHANSKQRGFVGSIPMAGICLGIFAGALMVMLCKSLIGTENFEAWGWRIPFIMGVFIVLVGIYFKKYSLETPEFENAKASGKILTSPLPEVIAKHKYNMLISILVNSTGSVLFYLEAIYLINYFKISGTFPEWQIETLNLVSYLVMAVVSVLSGWLSDKFGSVTIYTINLILILLFCVFGLELIESNIFSNVSFAYIFLAITAAAYIGPEPRLHFELYPAQVRSTALSLSYNLAATVFGGTAPYIIGMFVYYTGSIIAAKYYVLSCVLMSIIGIYLYFLETRKHGKH